jgi:2-amino-4-hydroxy-6-hydroxymethyldihydropteridine diphosphokinase
VARPPAPRIAHIGIGSNQDDPVRRVRDAFDELAALPSTRLAARSSLYRTAPVGGPDQPDFVNAVARVETALAPAALLQRLLAIEQRHGRVRGERNGPRALDLDLLLYADEVVDARGLQVPHPRMHERAFVLLPLEEVTPGLAIPGRGPVGALLRQVAGQRVQRIEEH